ncbi:MAG TPA: hypothetical protein VJB87_05680 [Candidatus Nanoarchaeia archaeon]|nr:hypothetical protein [Candidatus Nanoarchaeia archaeon]
MFPSFHKAKIFDKNIDLADRIQLGFTYFFRLAIIILLAAGIINEQWNITLFSLFLLILTFTSHFIENRFQIYLPLEFEFIAAALVYVSLYLGDLQSYYIYYWWWDIALHIGAGIVFGLLGFVVIYTIYRRDKIQLNKPFWFALFTFCFAMTIGGLWEILEFTIDQVYPHFYMQENGLVDTMWDLIVNGLGALLISILGYMYIKGGNIPFISRIMKKIKRRHPNFHRY